MKYRNTTIGLAISLIGIGMLYTTWLIYTPSIIKGEGMFAELFEYNGPLVCDLRITTNENIYHGTGYIDTDEASYRINFLQAPSDIFAFITSPGVTSSHLIVTSQQMAVWSDSPQGRAGWSMGTPTSFVFSITGDAKPVGFTQFETRDGTVLVYPFFRNNPVVYICQKTSNMDPTLFVPPTLPDIYSIFDAGYEEPIIQYLDNSLCNRGTLFCPR